MEGGGKHPPSATTRQKSPVLNFKDKGVMEGDGKHPPPPSATTRQKSPVLIGLTKVCQKIVYV